MASTTSAMPQQSTHNYATNPRLKSVKEVAESLNLTSIPSNYAYFSDPAASAVDHDDHDSIPVIDISLLQSGSPDQRSQVIQELGKACQSWGFFMVVNHGVPETLIKSMIDKCNEFFNLGPEEKQEYEVKHVLDPIRYGTSFNPRMEDVHFWRDYIKIMVHPEFHSPSKPHGFSEVSWEYCKQVRDVVRVLLRGISASLGLDELEIERCMDLDMGQQLFVANYYPPCPRPDLAIGMPPHSDLGLLTLLTQNRSGGLQVQHNGKWVPIHAKPNSLLVNISDQIEIFSNGKCKSVLHRAAVNNTSTRISIAVVNGPSLDAIVAPTKQLIDEDGGARYKSMKYREYMQLQQSKRLDGKSALDMIKM